MPPRNLPSTATVRPRPGGDLRPRAEALGLRLANALNLVVAALPGRPTGPRAVGEAVGMTIVSASRLLKAIGLTDPIAVLQAIPGPNPLSKMLDAVDQQVDARDAALVEARAAVAEFDAFIKEEAGDRGTLRAMLTAWLPDERREFDAQRRQTVYKAMAELDGVAADLNLSSIVIFPSETEGRLDLVNVQAMIGIDRMRPEARHVLGSARLGPERPSDPVWTEARMPRTLDGEPVADGTATVRLDEFCTAPPAPIVARKLEHTVEYELGPTGFGRDSKVDAIIAEVNRAELQADAPGAGEQNSRFFFLCPSLPTRRAVLDLVLHEDVLAGFEPELISFDTAHKGPANPADPAREADRRPIHESIEPLGHGARGARLVEFPRYTALLESVSARLGVDLDAFRVLRVSVSHALPSRQITVLFRPRR